MDTLETMNRNNQKLLDLLRENQNDHQKLQQLLNDGISIDKETKKVSKKSLDITDNIIKEPDWNYKKFSHLVVPRTNVVSMVLGPTSVYNDKMIMENQNITSNHVQNDITGYGEVDYLDNSNDDCTFSPNSRSFSLSHEIIDNTQEPSDPLNQRNMPLSNIKQKLTPEQISELEGFRDKYGYHSFKLFYFKPLKLQSNPKSFSIIRTSVSLFFKYMYSSSFLFIHRETFLYFFLNNEENCDFVSLELIYAISALGAKISTEENIRMKADEFYSISKTKVLEIANGEHFITESSITKLQTLLCLAFYDLGRGELTSSWLLSGLAFRVGFDFGFELDPKDWNVSFNKAPKARSTSTSATYSLSGPSSSTSSNVSVNQARENLYQSYPFDICQVRLRIYWGSYVADRFICLVTGRSSTLKLGDVTIPNTQDIGDLTGIEDFIYYDVTSSKQYACRAFHCLKAVVELLNLSEDISMKVFGPSIAPGTNRFDLTTEFNLKLLQWKQNLGTELFWNKSILKRTAHNELYMGPRYTFFIIILSINRPFVSMIALTASKNPTFVNSTPVKICDDIIDDMEIVIKALKVHETTYKVFKPHILAVYSTILTISILLWKFKIAKDVSQKNAIIEKVELFFDFLQKCSSIWTLAVNPVSVFHKKIETLYFDGMNDLNFFNEVQPPKLNSILSERITENKNNETFTSIKDPNGEYENDSNLNNSYIHTSKNIYKQQTIAERELNLKDNKSYGLEEVLCIDDLFQSFLAEPSSQQFLTRLDLADAMWDETLFSKGFNW
ncbi:unnamed protein product [Debaryomyces fabryi]|nr:unnamed protein product [Debaryomyces fabryi]